MPGLVGRGTVYGAGVLRNLAAASKAPWVAGVKIPAMQSVLPTHTDTEARIAASTPGAPPIALQATPGTPLPAGDISRIIEMAWEDRTPFEDIEREYGLNESAVIALMRREMKASSFRMWRKRMTGRTTKHRAVQEVRMQAKERGVVQADTAPLPAEAPAETALTDTLGAEEPSPTSAQLR